jgi:tetratricopeptide (TPR) repeat protein
MAAVTRAWHDDAPTIDARFRMTEALYERYKDALRRGHVAALRGRHDVALDAYAEASRLAPDRALPFVGIAGVLAGLGRTSEALAAYDAALDRGPTDEGALRGRADLLASTGDRIGAAGSLDRLATALDEAGRLADATDAARRALELAESRGRRDSVRHLAERLRLETPDPGASEALASALRLLAGPAMTSPPGATDPAADAPAPDDGSVTAVVVEPAAEPLPPFIPGLATEGVEAAAAAGDPATTLELALEASTGHRLGGWQAAAIDVCYLALAGNPADPALHLALAELYLDRGWRTIATDKLALLARLAELTGDVATRARICEVAAIRLPDEPRLAAICA